ncbi:MAG: hypothetical protein ABI905_08570 [Betaproteobacteria bacterium]
MNKICGLLSVLMFGFSMSVAFAQQPPPGPAPGAGGHPPPPRDCSKAPDAEKKARCEARQKAMEKCKDLAPEAHHKCMMDAMPKPPEK